MNRARYHCALVLSAGFAVSVAATFVVQSASLSTKTQSGAASIRDPRTNINLKPIRDLLTKTVELNSHGQIDLNSDFEFAVEANRDADCRLSHAMVVKKSGDSRLIELAIDLIAAISDSGLPVYLGDQEQTAESPCADLPLRFNLKNSMNEYMASVEFPDSNSDRAAQLARGYNAVIAARRLTKRGSPDEVLMNSLNATSEDKWITLHFQISSTNLRELLRQRLSH
jgi:hypothetical protein